MCKEPQNFFSIFSKSDRNPEIPGWFMDVFIVASKPIELLDVFATKYCVNLVESPQINHANL